MSTLVVSSYYKLKYDRWTEDIVSNFPHQHPYVVVDDPRGMKRNDKPWNPYSPGKVYGQYSVENLKRLTSLGHDVLLFTNEETAESVEIPDGIKVELLEFDQFHLGEKMEHLAYSQWHSQMLKLFSDISEVKRYPNDIFTHVMVERFLKVPWYYPVVANKPIQLGLAANKYDYDNFAWIDSHMWTSSRHFQESEFVDSYDWGSMIDRLVQIAQDKMFLWKMPEYAVCSGAFMVGNRSAISQFVELYKPRLEELVSQGEVRSEERIIYEMPGRKPELFNMLITNGYYDIIQMLRLLVEKTT